MAVDGRYQRLIAEAEVWPVTSEAAFRLRTLQIGHSATGVLDRDTQNLASALEDYLRTRSNGLSLEELRGLRQRCWFALDPEPSPLAPPPRSHFSLAEYLQRLAARHLACDGVRPTLNDTSRSSDGLTPHERVAHWRWLSLRIPPDLLIAALYAPRGSEEPSADQISLSTPYLQDILRQPVAETHLHAGAAFSFSTLWTVWMAWFTEAGPSHEGLRPDKYPLGLNGPGFLALLYASAIARLFLASFLQHNRRSPGENFESFLQHELPALGQHTPWPTGARELQRECQRVLTRLVSGNSQQSLALLERLYRTLARPLPSSVARSTPIPPSRAQSLEQLLAQDPLRGWLQPDVRLPSAETRFATRALRYLLSEAGQEDRGFALCFWQYQRVRCQAYTFFVQEPGTPGLDWFRVHFNRLSSFRGPLEQHLATSALQNSGRELHLGTIELRLTPEAPWTQIRDMVRNVASASLTQPAPLPPSRSPEVALLLHFIKEDTFDAPGARRLHADPSANRPQCRFARWFIQRRRQAIAIATALAHHPELLLILRALDIASAELATPTWVTAFLLKQFRLRSQQAAAQLRRRSSRLQAPALRLTCHAGEDFRRLVEGLRRVHELLESDLLRTGDRIGHGLALGEDPVRHALHHPAGVQPAEERLDDLLWELDRYGLGQIPTVPGRVEQVRREALALARSLYGPSSEDLDAFLEARRLRLDSGALSWLGFPDRRPRPSRDRALNLLWRYLTDVEVFRRGQHPVETHVHPAEVTMLVEAQRWLRSSLREKEITIETNPSSNLLVLNVAGLEHHPVMALGPGLSGGTAPGGDRAPMPPLLLSINSDDPVTFATSLADEYAYLASALVRAGESLHGALQWLERLRENGWRSRFSLPASSDQQSLLTLLSERQRQQLLRASAD